MRNRKSNQTKIIEGLFLMAENVTVKELFVGLFGDPGERTNREMSQAIGPALTRYCRRSGNDVQPTGTPYIYTLVFA